VRAREERRTQAEIWAEKVRCESRTAPSMVREGEKARSTPFRRRGVGFEGSLRRRGEKMVTVVLDASKAEEWDVDIISSAKGELR
jgi:hypothetical protein